MYTQCFRLVSVENMNCQRESHYSEIRFSLNPELRRWPVGHKVLFYAPRKFIADRSHFTYREVVNVIFFIVDGRILTDAC